MHLKSVSALSMLPKKFRVSSGGRLLSLSVTRSARMAEGGVPLFPPVRLLPQFTCGASGQGAAVPPRRACV